jgi:hypothetical protein
MDHAVANNDGDEDIHTSQTITSRMTMNTTLNWPCLFNNEFIITIMAVFVIIIKKLAGMKAVQLSYYRVD